MNHFKKFFLLVGLSVFILNGCNKEEPSPVQQNGQSNGSQVLKEILALGFAKENIEDKGDYYTVEGDIVFSKNVRSIPMQPSTKKGYPTNINSQNNGRINQYAINSDRWIVFGQQTYIRVRVDNSMPYSGVDNWRDEVQQAIWNWNYEFQNSNIYFELTTNASVADINIVSDNGVLANNAVASANYPNGNPGSQIWINLDVNSNATLSSQVKKGVIMHELGHCLGMRHTNSSSNTPGSEGANLIPTTAITDANSIMNSNELLGRIYPTANDKKAMSMVYPIAEIYAIQGSVPYAIDLKTGAWAGVGASGNWTGNAVTTIGNDIYVLNSSDGYVYIGNRKTGEIVPQIFVRYGIGESMTSLDENLYVVNSGTLFRINTTNYQIDQLGIEGDWSGLSFLTADKNNGWLFALWGEVLYRINPNDGSYQSWASGSDFVNVTAMICSDYEIFMVKGDELWRYSVDTGAGRFVSRGWSGVTAMTLWNGSMYIVKGDDLYMLSLSSLNSFYLSSTWTGTELLFSFE